MTVGSQGTGLPLPFVWQVVLVFVAVPAPSCELRQPHPPPQPQPPLEALPHPHDDEPPQVQLVQHVGPLLPFNAVIPRDGFSSYRIESTQSSATSRQLGSSPRSPYGSHSHCRRSLSLHLLISAQMSTTSSRQTTMSSPQGLSAYPDLTVTMLQG